MKWSDSQAGMHTTACIIQPNHSASTRLAEKVGFADAVLTHVAGDPVLQFRRTAR